MVVFPNAKINLGLNITGRRADGYHLLETVMVPVAWRDILEIVPSEHHADTLTVTGNAVDCPADKNLVMRAVKAVRALHPQMPTVDAYLHKVIPDGAGLGGGSADAAFAVMALNRMFELGMSTPQMAALAATLGSDCPFFVYNRPMLATGTGTDLAPADVNLEGLHIVIAKPQGVSVSTAQAYAGITPHPAEYDLVQALQLPVGQWQGRVCNDFETSIFALRPAVAALKQQMLDAGAVYAAMSGSGSAVFGVFADAATAAATSSQIKGCDVFISKDNGR